MIIINNFHYIKYHKFVKILQNQNKLNFYKKNMNIELVIMFNNHKNMNVFYIMMMNYLIILVRYAIFNNLYQHFQKTLNYNKYMISFIILININLYLQKINNILIF